MVRHPGADGRRQVVSHGSNGRIADKPLSLLHYIGMSAHHAGRAVSYHRDLVFLDPAADFLDRRVNVGGLPVSGRVMLRKHHRIFFLPFLAALYPPVYRLGILRAAVLVKLLLVQHQLQLLKKILHVRVDRHVHMERRLLKLLGIDVVVNDIRFPGPCLIIISNLADRQTASQRKKKIAVLNREISRTVAHVAGPSYVERMGIIHAVDAVPAGHHRNSQLIHNPGKHLVGFSDPDSVSGVDHRALRFPNLS